jgi:endonuclease/exonuclease/phosphatase family metal-dependent hydrolase
LQLATFNLHYGLDEAQLAGSIAAIRAQHADVIALQELSLPAAVVLRRELIGEYPYQALAPSESFSGMGLLSRYPLDLQPSPPELTAQLALMRMGSVDVTLLNVSLTSPELKQRRLPIVRWVKGLGGYKISKRSRDVQRLLQLIDQVRGPLVVAGDFNLSDREADYAKFAARLHDTYRESSWGFGHTYPSDLRLAGIPIVPPLTRIDYIWSAGGVVPVAARVACGNNSDHCMVIVDVQVGDGSAQSSAGRAR